MAGLINRDNYDNEFIIMSERINSYFISIFFNNIYNTASQNIKSKRSAVGDEYRRLIGGYVIAYKTLSKSYDNVTDKLYRYYQIASGTSNVSIVNFPSFISHIVEYFVPPEFFRDLTTSDREDLMNNILVDLVSALGVYVTTPELLRNIIDHHSSRSKETIISMQDHCLAFMQTKKEVIHNKFLMVNSEAKDVVSMDIVENMKNTMRDLLKTKIKYKAALDSFKANELKELRLLQAENRKLRRLVEIFIEERKNGRMATAHKLATPPPNIHGEVVDNGDEEGDDDEPEDEEGSDGDPENEEGSDGEEGSSGDDNDDPEDDGSDGDPEDDSEIIHGTPSPTAFRTPSRDRQTRHIRGLTDDEDEDEGDKIDTLMDF